MTSARALALAVALTAAAVLAWAGGARAADETPTQLLFESKHFADVAAGTVISYRYDRESADPSVTGPNFSDDIRMTVGAADANGDRTVAVEMFTGPRRRAAGPFSAMIGNPILMLFLEADVSGMEKLVGGNPRYLKNAIRAAFRQGGRVEPVTVSIDGVEHAAEKVILKPFEKDEHRRELGAFLDKTYEFIVSDSVPGALVELKTFTPKVDAPAEPYFKEEIRFVGAATAKD